MNYDDPITCLKGIGEKTAALYEKLGIVTGGGALIETALTEYKTEIESIK